MSDRQRVEERIRRKQEKRDERRKRDGVNCNLCCTDEETGTPGCIEESCKAICHNYCPKCPSPSDNKMAKVVPIDHGKPGTPEMQRGGRKTRRKRRKKRRKSRKNRKKTKRRRKRRRKKSKKVRRK